MKKNIRWITRTGVLLALLVTVQAVTKPFGQAVTGTCVNAILAIAALLGSLSCGLTLAAISPLLAFVLGIAPNIITVVPIALGNCCYVLVFHSLLHKSLRPLWKQPLALVGAAGIKYWVLYLLVVQGICNLAAGSLLGKKLGEIVLLAPPMLNLLPTMFSWPQLFTALAGGIVALAIVNTIRTAVQK